MNVLIVPEDFREDQYILKPVIERMFREIGKPRANIQVCLDPPLGGVEQALRWERIRDVIEMYPMVDVFLLVVDRDGVAGRRVALDRLEVQARELLGPDRVLLAEQAWQEVEVWALAGQELPKEWSWAEIRAEVHPKEAYFIPLAERRGLTAEPGEGRATLGREAAANYKRLVSRCRSDIVNLQNRLSEWLNR
jgi:hypothetical protein